MAAYIATSSALETFEVSYRECIFPHHPHGVAKKNFSAHLSGIPPMDKAARHLPDMFEQLTPLRGHSRQKVTCGRLGITLSLAEQSCGIWLIESDSGARAVS
jgi:hypothetical protein